MEEITEKEPSEVLTPDANNATFFKPSEGSDNHHQKYKRLRLYNRGTWKDRREENKEVTHRRDNLAILDAIASQLDLTDYQKSESRRTFDGLELGDIGKPADLIAFAVCIVVANDEVKGTRYYPTKKSTDGIFSRVSGRLGYSVKKEQAAIGNVEDRRM